MDDYLKNDKFFPSSEQIEKEYRRREQLFWNWLIWSLVYYVGVNLLLIAINWVTCPHYWWVWWVIGGWGISLLTIALEKSMKY